MQQTVFPQTTKQHKKKKTGKKTQTNLYDCVPPPLEWILSEKLSERGWLCVIHRMHAVSAFNAINDENNSEQIKQQPSNATKKFIKI